MVVMIAEITIVIMTMIEVHQEVTETVVEEEVVAPAVEDPPVMKTPTVFSRL